MSKKKRTWLKHACQLTVSEENNQNKMTGVFPCGKLFLLRRELKQFYRTKFRPSLTEITRQKPVSWN